MNLSLKMSLNLKIFGVFKNIFLQWEACIRWQWCCYVHCGSHWDSSVITVQVAVKNIWSMQCNAHQWHILQLLHF